MEIAMSDLLLAVANTTSQTIDHQDRSGWSHQRTRDPTGDEGKSETGGGVAIGKKPGHPSLQFLKGGRGREAPYTDRAPAMKSFAVSGENGSDQSDLAEHSYAL